MRRPGYAFDRVSRGSVGVLLREFLFATASHPGQDVRLPAVNDPERLRGSRLIGRLGKAPLLGEDHHVPLRPGCSAMAKVNEFEREGICPAAEAMAVARALDTTSLPGFLIAAETGCLDDELDVRDRSGIAYSWHGQGPGEGAEGELG